MDQETPNLLPFSQTTRITLAAAAETRQLLAKRLLPELAGPIASFSYNPWIATRRDDGQEYGARSSEWSNDDYSVAALYLFTEPLPKELKIVNARRIIFQTRAADQGWATFGGEGTFENSHTWFEASILRPRGADNDGADASFEAILGSTWWDVRRSRDELRNHGWDFVEGEDGRLTWRVCNNLTASRRFRNYRVEWEEGVVTNVEDEMAMGRGEGFLELLGPGCIVVLWARAEVGLRDISRCADLLTSLVASSLG